MTELKTLKDIEKPDEMKALVEVDRLKAEAVKWVKMDESHKGFGNIDWIEGRIDFIKHFFNLTEEDLK